MNTIPQLEGSKLIIDNVFAGFYNDENFKIRVLYLHPESGLYGTVLIETVDEFIKELKEVFDWGFGVEFQIEK